MSTPIQIKAVPAASTWALRQRVLRPGHAPDACHYPLDNSGLERHFAAMQGDKVLSVASAFREDEEGRSDGSIWRLRGMATAAEVRGTGVGSRVLAALLVSIRNSGATAMWANARIPALSFYERFGFTVVGEEFDIPSGGPHKVIRRYFAYSPPAPADLGREAQAMLRFIEEQWAQRAKAPVLAPVSPGDVARQFATTAPEVGQSMQTILAEIAAKIMPGLSHWQHPRFFAYYPASSSVPAVLSELLIAALGAVGLQWSANPAATELECVVMDWLLRMLHAPADSDFLHQNGRGGGLIQNTAGEALAVVMTAARLAAHVQDRAADKEPDAEELEELYAADSSKLVVYMSDQTHFAGPKAVRVAGMRLRKLPVQLLVDGNYGITAAQVLTAMAEDRTRGLRPAAVLLNYGSTNTCGYDELTGFRKMAVEEKIWLHVDAAYAGAALILPERQTDARLIQEIASSFNFNGSKWLLCGFDSAFLYVRDRRWLLQLYAADDAFMAPPAVEQTYSPEFRDWSVPLGRRFRALRIWMVLSYHGVKGLQVYLRETLAQADWLRAQIDASTLFRQIARTDLGLVCFALATEDAALQDAFMKALWTKSEEGRRFLVYPSKLGEQRFLRVAIGGSSTTSSDISFLWQHCLSAAAEVGAAARLSKDR